MAIPLRTFFDGVRGESLFPPPEKNCIFSLPESNFRPRDCAPELRDCNPKPRERNPEAWERNPKTRFCSPEPQNRSPEAWDCNFMLGNCDS